MGYPISVTRRLLIVGAGLVAATSSFASESQPAAPRAGTTLETGSIVAERHGERGKALVFIPGLAGGAWSWAEMARRLSPTFAVHALTLPGFDGRPAIAAPLIETVTADIARFIEDNRLDRPIVIGHSLGAVVALQLGVRHPSLIGGLIAVDGYPVFPALANADAEGRRSAAQRLAEQFFAANDAERFRATMQIFLTARMNDPQRAAQIADRAARSDPRATGAYVVEMLSADLRPELSRLKAPLLALAAVDSYLSGHSEQEIRDFYSALLASAPDASVLLVRNARHFVMEDQPDVVCAAIEAFAAGLRRSAP